MSSQPEKVKSLTSVPGRGNTRTKQARIPKISDLPRTSEHVDIKLDAVELRMILAYRSMLPRYQTEISRIVDGLTEIPGALRFKAPVLRLVVAGDAS